MMSRSQILEQFQVERARYEREWHELLAALQELDPKCHVAVQEDLLEALDCALTWKVAPRASVSALRV